jgi:hypothetical protein
MVNSICDVVVLGIYFGLALPSYWGGAFGSRYTTDRSCPGPRGRFRWRPTIGWGNLNLEVARRAGDVTDKMIDTDAGRQW